MNNNKLRQKPQKEVLVNDEIRAKTVRLVEIDGKQVGIYPTREAIRLAKNENSDLVQITPGEPAICRITDYGKYVFELKKHQRENSRRQRELTVETKEIQLRPVTETNDLMVKAKRAQEFLNDGDKVKVVVRFKGRERSHKEIANAVVKEFLEALGEYKIERELQDTGRDMLMFLAPVKSKSEILKEKQATK